MARTLLLLLLVLIAKGKATRYDPGVMLEVVANRVAWGQLDPARRGYRGFVAVADCEYVGETVWLQLPDGEFVGPYLVADCGRACDQERLARIHFAVDLSWRVALHLGVVDRPMDNVKVYMATEGQTVTPRLQSGPVQR